VCQVGHLPELYKDAWSEKYKSIYKKKNIKLITELGTVSQ